MRVEVQRLDKLYAKATLSRHGHRFFEIIFLERGELQVIRPGELHDLQELAGAAGYLVVFHADALGVGLSDTDLLLPGDLTLLSFLRPSSAGALTLHLPLRARRPLAARMAELERELSERRPGYEEMASALLRLVLVDIARLAGTKVSRLSLETRPLLLAVFRFIERRYRTPISLADVARAVGRSRAHLTDVVRRQTGRPVLAWIVERRMAEARRRLFETDEEVGAIAEAVSYSDAGYFIRQFRRLHGMTPTRWRAKHRR
jgi:AraC-like DNA-binding protein